MPRGVFRYAWEITGRSRIWLSILSTSVFLVDLAPLELQRRIVNDAIKQHALATIVWLCLGYLAVAAVQGALKLAMNIYRSKIGETATRDLRRRTRAKIAPAKGVEGQVHEGIQVSIVVSEVDPVGGFIGLSVFEPLLHGGVLVSVFGYMLIIQPWMALVCFLMFAPQLLFVPMMQGTINRRTKSRIQMLREVSVEIIDATAGDKDDREDDREDGAFRNNVDRIYRVDMSIFRLKFTMNFLMNVLHHAAIAGVLLVGGWFVVEGRTEVGTIVAFISGLDRVNDPWGDLVNYFREMNGARIKYDLISGVMRGEAPPAAIARAGAG